MRLAGYRPDGTLRVLIPGGMTVLVRGDFASPPLDDAEADRYGPWLEPAVSLSGAERQQLAKRLDRARVVSMQRFALAKGVNPFAKKAEGTPEEEATESPAEEATEPAAEDAAEPAAKAKADPTVERGNLLQQIQAIAESRVKKEPPQPRFGKKRLKLEYEIEDAVGERPAEKEKKAKDEKEKAGPPTAVGVPHAPGGPPAEVPTYVPEEAPDALVLQKRGQL